ARGLPHRPLPAAGRPHVPRDRGRAPVHARRAPLRHPLGRHERRQAPALHPHLPRGRRAPDSAGHLHGGHGENGALPALPGPPAARERRYSLRSRLQL
ncbi:MAG: hypothetical protein AVDCRST_MAG89-1241, partial [uncultured Gemmatimonadetes bacterium]